MRLEMAYPIVRRWHCLETGSERRGTQVSSDAPPRRETGKPYHDPHYPSPDGEGCHLITHGLENEINVKQLSSTSSYTTLYWVGFSYTYVIIGYGLYC